MGMDKSQDSVTNYPESILLGLCQDNNFRKLILMLMLTSSKKSEQLINPSTFEWEGSGSNTYSISSCSGDLVRSVNPFMPHSTD